MNKLWKRILAMTLVFGLTASSICFKTENDAAWAAEPDLTDGLVGYWTFEGETESDRLASKASVSNVTAVKTGDGVTLNGLGEGGSNGTISFQGSNSSYLTLNLVNAGMGLTSSNAFTLGAWIKYQTMTGDNTSVFHQDGTGSGRAILTIGSNGKYGTYLDASNRYCSQTVQRQKWHHIMLSVDAADVSPRKVRFYLDGVLTNEETLTGSLVDGSGNIRVGAHRDHAANSAVNGTMDEIRYYNKVIDASAVKAIYDLHSEGMETQEVRERLQTWIERAEALHADGTDEAAANLRQAIQRAEAIKNNASAQIMEIEEVITQLQEAVQAYEAGMPITIEVDTSNEIRNIPSAMFGINHRYHNYGYGTWDRENNKINDAFDALTKEANFGSVRYPGGTVSNLFTWKDTIGEERTTTIAGNNFYSNAGEQPVDPAFGVDEAMKWIYDDLNAEAIFVYGLGRGNPEDAADLVEYLNAPNDGSNPNGGTDWARVRAENGHEEPYGVVRFELGNEFSDTGQNYWMSGLSENNKGVVDLYIEGDRMTISGQTSYFQTNNKVAKKGDWRASASLSDGNPNEERYVYYLPVVQDTAEVFVAGTKWEVVDSLAGKGAENVCTFDYKTGKITFGDGTNGNIPARGAQITCNYKTDQAGFVAYYEAMKAVDPNIELYSGIYDGHQNSFIDKMHQKGYDDKYDGVIIHPYSKSVTGYGDSLVKAKNYSNQIATYKNKMHTVTNDDSKKVAVSEFGILSVSPASNYQTSLGHAIYIANHMIDCVNAGAAYQNKHCLVDTTAGSDNLGAWQQCVIQCHEGSEGNQYVSTPSARLFSLFNQMTGNHQVSETVVGNDVFTGSGNTAVNNINVYSTTDDDGNTYVMVVNNKEESAASVALSIKDRNLTGQKIQVWSLASENVTDMNTLAEPDKITVEKTEVTAEEGSFVYTLAPHAVYSFKIPEEKPIDAGEIVETGSQEGGMVTGIPDQAMPGDVVTVTAEPEEGYEFAGWFIKGSEEMLSADKNYTFTVTPGQTLQARFAKKTFQVKVTAQTGGSASSSVSQAPYQTSVTVTASLQAGYEFAGWYEGNKLVSKEIRYTFSLQKDTELTAKFTKKPSEQETITKPEVPKGLKAKKAKKGIQLSWKKTNGAHGYVIYRSYKKKKGYKKIAEIKKGGTKKYLDKKAKKGKTAYYKIKSYKNSNGKKVLSGTFSKVVSKKR